MWAVGADPEKLATFIDEAGLSYKENTVSYIFDCPRCSKKEKLYLRKRDGRFICWYCAEIEGYQGRPEIALADLCGKPIDVVRKALYAFVARDSDEYFDLRIPDFFGDGDEVDSDVTVIDTVKFPWDYYPIDHTFSSRGLKYLEGRGITKDLAVEYGLRYAPKDRRIIFPVEVGGRLVGWQARLVVPHQYWNEELQDMVTAQKMLSSKGIPTAHTVMFSNRLKGSKHVVVCEGPIDAMKAHLCGGNVATMGKAVSQGQIKMLRDPQRLTKKEVGIFKNAGIERIYLALDPDAARETTRLIREFCDLEVYLMHPPAGHKDLGEMSLGEVRDLFERAPRVSTSHIFVHFGG